jgi:excisionase family DNA binding protein
MGIEEVLPVPETQMETNTEPRIGRSVSLDDAAALLGVSRRTIYNRIRDGRLQTIRTPGGSQRVLIGSMQDAKGLSAWRRPSRPAGTDDGGSGPLQN